MDKNIERPILIVNFQESMIQQAFKESLTVQGSSAENKRTMVTVLTAELPSEVSAGIRTDGLVAYSRTLSRQYNVPVTVGVGGIHGDFPGNAKISCKEALEAAGCGRNAREP